MPIARQGLGGKIYFLSDFAVLKINSNQSPGWFAWKRPKKETQSGCGGEAHVFSATRPPQVHRQSEQPPRYKTSALWLRIDANGKESFSKSTFTKLLESFLPTPLQKPGIMEPALKFRSVQGLYSKPLNWHWWWRFWYGADKGTIGSSSQVIDLHPGFKRSRTLEILQSSEWSKS